MVTNKSVLGASLTETIQADFAQPTRRAARADRPLPGVAPMMALAGRDEELGRLDDELVAAKDMIARLEDQLAQGRAGGATEQDVARLSRELAEARASMEGVLPTRLLDANDVVLSRFINRHPDSYRDAEYVQLRDEIRAAGGNTQPIGVRPLAGSTGKFELSFGSRRRQACLELGLPVLAMIDQMDDVVLFERMERENRQRKNLRPYEQAVLYLQALDAKIYPSIRKMSEALQLNSSGLSRLIALARLPEEVIAAFESPLDIKFDWGITLTDAVARNRRAVVAKAVELVANGPPRRAQAVHDALIAAAGGEGALGKIPPTVLRGQGKESATVMFDGARATVKVAGLSAERRAALEAMLKEFLAAA